MSVVDEIIRIIVGELDPVSVLEIKKAIEDNIVALCCKKGSTASIISINKDNDYYCKKCNYKFSKNGITKSGIQKYICPKCKKTMSERTETISLGSKLPFSIWKNVIDNILNSFSIRRIATENKISIDTSFRMRQKVLIVIRKKLETIDLQGKVWIDAQYFSLNFKGTKTKNMPRFSKKRKSKSSLNGISHHKVCVIGALDENDNLILKIGGLGKGTNDMLENCLGKKVKKVKEITSDSASTYIKFCQKHKIILHQIPSGFNSDGIENLSEINNVHSQLKTWLAKYRGVSTRHFQEYLYWFAYLYMMLKKYESKKLQIKNYKDILTCKTHIKSRDICKIELPVDPMIAYAEYHHQSKD